LVEDAQSFQQKKELEEVALQKIAIGDELEQ